LGFLLIAKGPIAQILVTWNHVGGGFFLQILVAQSSRVVSWSDHLAGRNRGLLVKKIQMYYFQLLNRSKKSFLW
jgi:p-aminobenzoyl-glutamate transporter AbgT